MTPRAEDLTRALAAITRDDLAAMDLDQLDRLEWDLNAWASLTMVAAMTKRAAMREEETE
jgi:hypothetical protein